MAIGHGLHDHGGVVLASVRSVLLGRCKLDGGRVGVLLLLLCRGLVLVRRSVELLLEGRGLVRLRRRLVVGHVALSLKAHVVRLPVGVGEVGALVCEGAECGTLQEVHAFALQVDDRNDRPASHEGGGEEQTVEDLCQLYSPGVHGDEAKDGNGQAESCEHLVRLPAADEHAERSHLLVHVDEIPEEATQDSLQDDEEEDGLLPDKLQQKVGEDRYPPHRRAVAGAARLAPHGRRRACPRGHARYQWRACID
mmetsp:Transcript_64055/g.198309  ORF Transcript_64055/g.198309 Transcript_64055/m.198309 type:complete len:252 (+) Transcript_64055:1295-2050(+)